MIKPTVRLGAAVASSAELGESPAIDHNNSLVWWIDIAGRRLHRSDIKTSATTSWTTPQEPGFVVLDQSGQPVVGMETGLFAFDLHDGSWERLLNQEHLGHRFNDAAVDPDGNLWVSTMSLSAARGEGKIWRITTGMTLMPVVEGLSIPNGMAIDGIRNRLYYSDSHPGAQTIWAAPISASGEVGKASTFADMKSLAGRPDGAALDAEGCYWIAAVDGAALEVFSPGGEHLFEVSVPVTYPTKLAFYGEHCENLVVTSKRDSEHGGRLVFLSFDKQAVRGTRQARWNRR